MIENILQILTPDHCYGCGKIGQSLCIDCKYDITSEPFSACVWCLRPTVDGSVCSSCSEGVERAWAVGERSEVLRAMIDAYKFQHRRSLAKTFAELVDTILPELPADTIVCELPTVSAHIRQRSFDHTKRIARQLASKRNLEYEPLLRRVGNERQYGSSRRARLEQASRAFMIDASGKVAKDRPVLLFDDVLTTGASIHFASKALLDAGHATVWVAIIARQPLDQTDEI